MWLAYIVFAESDAGDVSGQEGQHRQGAVRQPDALTIYVHAVRVFLKVPLTWTIFNQAACDSLRSDSVLSARQTSGIC